MPDASSTPSSLSAAAHEDFVTFLSARHKEVHQHGTMALCIPSHGEISVLPTFRCSETSLRNLYDKYQVDPTIARRLPMYFRRLDEMLASIAAVDTRWSLKNHHTLPLIHTSWSPEVIEASSERARMCARRRYADAVAGFALAACSQFFIDGLKPQAYHGESSENYAIQEFLHTHCTDKVGFTYTLLELERLTIVVLLSGLRVLLHITLLISLFPVVCLRMKEPPAHRIIPIMAELTTDLYRPEIVDGSRQSLAVVETLSPTDELVNGPAPEVKILSKKEKKKKKKRIKEERLLAESSQTPPPCVNGQKTVFADGSVAVESVTAAYDPEPLPTVSEAIIEAALPEDDPVPEVESVYEPLSESPLTGHINGAVEIDIPPPVPDEPQEVIYLPFSAQHKLMVHLQERLETMCFSFAQRVMPHALEARGWDCPEMVQLHHWMEDSVFQDYAEQKVPDVEQRGQILNSVIEIRRCAVDRKRIDTTVLDTLVSSALRLAKLVEEAASVDEIERLGDNVVQTADRLAEETQVLQARYETKLQKIASGRAKIIMLIRGAECSTPKVALPGVSTARSCLDWINDLESSLALGEDDHEDLFR
ncbi:uncharacterized protein BKA55DRAFT_592049 [Fusarium redolens]|uniref:Uncharacterized protein n=1 Tax=Fusarium redolens TaxID=48865 RepID=A0A9P9HLS4_FUSRE|nr:uncharacterized protein BKA55DRAFT_592049 [Fusarium redolens]KAH7259283.1 hypothetical protein BKA55DRAFT_592049 [Fusarium redolens]